jgi:hypothetical protein
MMRLSRHHLIFGFFGAAVLGCAALNAGCGGDDVGYTARELYPADVHTIAVDIFDNRSFQRNAELDLTEALTKEIEVRTPYKVVGRNRADTVMTGTITAIDRRTLSRTFDGGIPQEVQVTVNATFQWKDQRSGKVLRRRSMQGTGEHVPTRYVSEPYETAQHRAMTELARDIVSAMQRDW